MPLSSMLILLLLQIPGATQPAPTAAVSDDAVIATIGDKQVTVGDFVGYYQKRVEQSQPDNRPSLATAADAQQLLDDILNARAVLISAEKDGYDKHDDFIKAYNEIRDKTLLDELINRREKDLTVTTTEVEDFYQKSSREYHVSLILLYSQEEAQSLMPQLRQPGADFAALAQHYSRDTSTRNDGGKISEPVKYSPQEPWISIFRLGKGEISDPLYIPSAYAWGIFRVDDITEVTNLPPLEKVKNSLAEQIRAIKQEQIQEAIRTEAMSKASVKRDDVLLNLLYTGDPAQWDKPGMAVKTVSRVDGHTIAFGELLKFVRANFRDPAQSRRDDPALFRQLLQIRLGQLEKEQAVIILCLAQGLDKEPGVVAKLGQFQEKELVMEYLRDNVESKIPKPSEQQIAAYYQAHKGEEAFLESEKISTTILLSDQKDRLEETKERMDKGEDIEMIVDDINKRVLSDPTFKIPPQANPELYRPIFLLIETIDARNNSNRQEYIIIRSLEPGSWSQIFFLYNMYFLARLDSIQSPRVKTLQEAHDMIYRRIEEQIEGDPTTNQRCIEILGQIRNRYPITIDENTLELARQKAALINVTTPSIEQK